MSDLYDKLEVSKNASKEVIDKAYHVLVKKYHPDLQTDQEKKKIAEEKIKEINDAYEILGDESKRKEYDFKLQQELEEEKRIKEKEQIEILERMKQQEITLKQKQNQINNQYKNLNVNQSRYEGGNKKNNKEEQENLKKIQESINQAYRNAYKNYMQSLGYRIKEPWTWKRLFNMIMSLVIMTILIIIIWFFPPTHKILMDFYEKNTIIRTLLNIFVSIIQGIGEGIKSFFKNLF